MRFAFSSVDEVLPGGSGKCLDLGCGTGRLRAQIESRGYVWIGMDVEIRGCPDGMFVLGDAHSMPFTEEAFSVVLLNSVLAHLQDPHLAMKEVYRILKKGGYVCGVSSFLEPFCDVASYCHFSHVGVQRLLETSRFTVIKMEAGVTGLFLFIRAFCGERWANALRPFLKLVAWLHEHFLGWRQSCRYGRVTAEQLMSEYQREAAFRFAGHILWVGRKD